MPKHDTIMNHIVQYCVLLCSTGLCINYKRYTHHLIHTNSDQTVYYKHNVENEFYAPLQSL